MNTYHYHVLFEFCKEKQGGASVLYCVLPAGQAALSENSDLLVNKLVPAECYWRSKAKLIALCLFSSLPPFA